MSMVRAFQPMITIQKVRADIIDSMKAAKSTNGKFKSNLVSTKLILKVTYTAPLLIVAMPSILVRIGTNVYIYSPTDLPFWEQFRNG